jgi:hypothetical protein
MPAENTNSDTLRAMRRWYWILDAVVVVSFALIGSDFHGFTFDIVGILGVAAQFLIAQGVGTAALRSRTDPLSIVSGLLIALVTLVGGMLLRRFVWDDRTPLVFILVAGAYFASVMAGWRLIGLGAVWISNRQ